MEKTKKKLNEIISKVEKGGLNMLDIDSTVHIRRVMSKSGWKAFLNELLIPVFRKLILHCSFDTSKLFIYLVSNSNVSMRGQK